MFFRWIFENEVMGGGVLARFFALFVCARRMGSLTFQKNSLGVCWGGDGQKFRLIHKAWVQSSVEPKASKTVFLVLKVNS